MKGFLKSPQLPSAAVSTLVIGECYMAEFAPALEHLSVECYGITGPEVLDPRLRGHADLLLLHTGNAGFIAADGIQIHNKIINISYVNLLNNDSALNICILGEYWIGCPSRAAWLPDTLKKVAVRQRYARCSTCIVDEHSIITSDHGIAQAAAAHGLDVLEITPGHILLDGFNYGFIGGASFKLAPDKLAFTGALRHHPDQDRIRGFLSKRSIEPVCLGNGPLSDIGSAVLLYENLAAALP